MSETADLINEKTQNLNSKLRQREIYDPRILDVDDTSKALWNSESVELAVNGIANGYKLRDYPFLKNVKNGLIRKANLAFKYSEEELDIIQVCSEDKEFFANNFGKLKTEDKGWINIALRNYQCKMLRQFDLERWSLLMLPRQSGKTVTTVIELVHYALFNIDKDIVVVAQNDKSVNEILSKIKEFIIGLPFFLQPGVLYFNKKGCAFDNGCKIVVGVASESLVQGLAIDFLFIDEFAYIRDTIIRKFWNNIYPALSNNPKSKCIIASTPNGRNYFFEFWKAAEGRVSRFIPFRIYWWEVPGRDEQFKLDTIANTSIEAWEMGFECSFDTALKSIFATQVQKRLREIQLQFENEWSIQNHYLGEKFNMKFVSQNKIPFDFQKDYFILGIDISEGLDQDSSVAKLRKVSWDSNLKKLVYESVGIFKSNDISVEDFAQWFMDFSKYFKTDRFRAVIENNTYGAEFFSQVKSLKINDPKYSWFDNIIIAKFMRKAKDDYENGIRWNHSNKRVAVKSLADLTTQNIMRETNYDVIEEYLNFGKGKNDVYKAQYGHDDTVMADVSTSHFIKSNNIYATAFLKVAESDLRALCNDEDIELVRKREEEQRKKDSVYKTENGFELRNHAEHVKTPITDDYLMGLLQ